VILSTRPEPDAHVRGAPIRRSGDGRRVGVAGEVDLTTTVVEEAPPVGSRGLSFTGALRFSSGGDPVLGLEGRCPR